MGDFNAHHDSWYSTLRNPRGDSISDLIDNSLFTTLNTDTPTRLPSNGSPSSPDLSLTPAHLFPSFSWSTSTTLNSDHLPILLSILDSSPPTCPARLFINFKLARWREFKEESECHFDRVPAPTSCDQGEKVFRQILLTAAKHNFPAGFWKTFTNGLPREAVPLARRRDAARLLDPTDPEVGRLNEEIAATVNAAAQATWSKTVESASSSSCATPFWHLLRRLSGKRIHTPPNNPITFHTPQGPRTYTKKSAIAKRLNKQYVAPFPRHQSRLTCKSCVKSKS